MKKGIALPFIIILASVALILAAFFVLGNKPKAPSRNSTLIQSSSPAPENDNTDEGSADWKTYTNTKYGFEFKYPQDWNLEQNDRSAIPYIAVTIGDKSRNFSMNFQATENSGEPLGFMSQIKYEVALAQQKATAYLFPEGYECYEDQVTGKKPEDCSFFHVQLVKGNFKYLVVGFYHIKEGKIDPIYLQILSTFKFTN